MVPMISLQFPLCPQFWKPCPQFWKSEEGCQKWPILTTQKLNMMAKKKVFSQIHIDMCFLQKNGFKLVKFGLCGSIYILHPAIGGSHPVPCLSTQLAERQGTAMYYLFLAITSTTSVIVLCSVIFSWPLHPLLV